MKQFPKIVTVVTDLGRLRLYKPLSMDFWRIVRGRVPELTRVSDRTALFFRRRTSIVKVFNSFNQIVKVQSSVMKVLNFSYIQKRRVFRTEGNFLTKRRDRLEEGKKGYVAEKSGKFQLHSQSKEVGQKQTIKRALPKQKVHKKGIFHKLVDERVTLLRSKRFVIQNTEFRIDRVDNEERDASKTQKKGNPKPVSLFYVTRNSSSMQAAPLQKEMKTLVEREKEFAKNQIHLRSETKEILREKRKEIEVISEKVYLLVMRKWEQERRRRGALYD